MERLSPEAAELAAEWLEAACPHGSLTGYDVGGWPANLWVVHAMYETKQLPGGLTHDDVGRMERAARAGTEPPPEPGSVEKVLEELLEESWLIGSALGASAAPGNGWERLFWDELGRRLNHDPWALDAPPCFRSFPYKSWPANIRPPAEGSLDREQAAGLVEHLAAVSLDGAQTPCFALFAGLPVSEFDAKVVYTGELGDLLGLYDEREFGPANLWPEDKAWLTYSDYDLWGTRVDGSDELVALLRADPELETIDLPFGGSVPPT
jgi:hypothetical protein